MDQTPHIAIVPAPGMGHLIPLVEFAKRLIKLQHFKFSVTFIIPDSGPLSNAQDSFLESLPPNINYILLPPVNFDDLHGIVKMETRLILTIIRSLPLIRDALRSLVETTRLVALVADTFGSDAFDIAREFNVSPYLFYGSGAMCLSFSFIFPELDEKVLCEFRDMDEPVCIPGFTTLYGKDFLEPLQDRKSYAYKMFLHLTKRSLLVDGIIINTFKKLEPGTIKALRLPCNPPIYPIGPLVEIGSSSKTEAADMDGSDCLKWLDDQPVGSVLYVSFGSGGTLSYDQLNELAIGLELSEQRFLWVVRKPNDKAANGAYFDSQNVDPLAFLPKGYIDRIEGRGLVVHDWAPQAQILSHSSTGGFLTHCGWSSILESVMNGIPMIAWPLFAEQKVNAVMVNDVLKVALRPKTSENGLIERVEIGNVVRNLMDGDEGKTLRVRMRELKNAAKEELSKDGSSSKSLLEVASKWNSTILK